MRRAGRSGFIAGGLLFLIVGFAPAQSSSSGSFTGGSSSGSSGSSGSFLGSSSGGSSGSSSSSGSFLGSSSSSGSSNSGGNNSSSGTNTVGSTSPLGRYYGNPLYNGLAAGSTSSASATGSKYLRAAPVPVSFSTALYNNTATTTRTQTQGQTGLSPYTGATSAGLRRAPGYVTEPVFDMPARPTLAAMRPELQEIVDRATRLPSRDRIRVLTDGDTVVLRGQVSNDRERRLAEALIRLSPGVRLVRNELEPVNTPPPK